MTYYEVDLIEMGFCKDDPKSSTADPNEWNDPLKPDMYNILVTEHLDDDSGEIDMIHDIDVHPSMAGTAQQLFRFFEALANYANTHDVEFGSVGNPYDKK